MRLDVENAGFLKVCADVCSRPEPPRKVSIEPLDRIELNPQLEVNDGCR